MKKIPLFVLLLTTLSIYYLFLHFHAMPVMKQEKRIYEYDQKDRISNDFIPNPLKLVAIGDSLTKGIGASKEKEGYLYYLEKDLLSLKGVSRVDVTNFGQKGIQSSDLLEKLQDEDVIASVKEANLILITIGGNDIMQVIKDNFYNLQMDVFDEELDQFETRLNHIFATIRGYNHTAPILFVSLYNPFSIWFQDIKEMQTILMKWNRRANEIVENDLNAYFVNVSNIFAENGLNILHDDYFHPNDKGYQLIAEAIFAQIKENEKAIFNVNQP